MSPGPNPAGSSDDAHTQIPVCYCTWRGCFCALVASIRSLFKGGFPLFPFLSSQLPFGCKNWSSSFASWLRYGLSEISLIWNLHTLHPVHRLNQQEGERKWLVAWWGPIAMVYLLETKPWQMTSYGEQVRRVCWVAVFWCSWHTWHRWRLQVQEAQQLLFGLTFCNLTFFLYHRIF